ncbi:hypothetical protein J1C67_16340 [Clostridium gasigenes]|uniref:hypothetical protein n=1 Tax=Clostridium gasigenes TaxID=94869 RepID=UPI001438547A|nr:hypothetical protein [Clostridium gasigenes]NKF05653.1 hypothetical protein [Clostridium gasigenes]QSW19091.1 hypothetical protein J1C67_16340 [Clostridium gasigenes]
MLDLLIKSLFIVVPMLLSMVVYYKVDKEYTITDKVSLKIKVDKKWQPLLVVCCSFTFVIILDIVSMHIINIPTNLFFIFSSLTMGIGVGFANKLQNKNKQI